MDAVQEEPFHCSTKGMFGVVPASPTAIQKLTLVHETPRSAELAVAATPCMTVQAEPFHSKIRGVLLDDPPVTSPPATQKEVVTQSTPKNENDVAPGIVGNATGVQVDPFHNSEEATSDPKRPPPTDIQKVDVTHETLPERAFALGEVTAFGMFDQFEALTCAGAVKPWGALAPPPVASRSVIGSASSATAHPADKRRIANRISASPSRPGGGAGERPATLSMWWRVVASALHRHDIGGQRQRQRRNRLGVAQADARSDRTRPIDAFARS
jgi:hypothetical protein